MAVQERVVILAQHHRSKPLSISVVAKAGDIPLVPCATTVGTRRVDHGTACAPRPRHHPRQTRAARTQCPELLLPKLQTQGKMEVEIRETPKSFTQNTLRDFFLNHKKFSFRRSKSCRCLVSWNLMVQETVHSLWASSLLTVRLFLGHEAA